ncbi:uncharacterized protein PRD47_008632 [Ara ararauna]
MAEQNHTSAAEFILKGLSDQVEMKAALFVLLLLIYTITLLGNAGIIVAIRGHPQLHTSMYFFLGSLSIVDICFSSVVAPRTLVNFLLEKKTISFAGCMGQAFFYIVFVTSECFLLAVMAYDRYVAICNPLLYSSVMTRRLCVGLVVGCYIGGVLNSIIQMTFIIRLPFCSSNVINHFFCDVPPLLALSCSSTYINEMILFSLAGIIELSTISAILVSYIFIFFAILRIRSVEGRRKAFSTCVSHLIVVTMLYGTTIFMYLRPSSSYSLNTDKVVSVFYTVVIPMLNPLIYSLRNKEMKDALRRTAERITVRLECISLITFISIQIHQLLEMTDGGNLTAPSSFILLGFSDAPELQTTIFTVFFSLYVLMALGNLMMILLINTDPHLHIPMYFFLSHLSCMDFCLSSAITPKALETFLLGTSHISFWGCFAQMYIFIALAVSENFLLGVMAFDRYTAVCKPLLYTTTMTRARCYGMVVLVYTMGFLTSLVHITLVGRLSFCQARSINHFFCELPTLLQLSCSDTHRNKVVLESSAAFNIMVSVLMILVSYTCILHSVLQIPLGRRRLKVFSTCTSHLAAVTVFYAPLLLTYVQPHEASSWDQAKLVSVCYCILTPTLNPLIYSLRNKEVKGALRRLWERKLMPHLSRF